MGHQVMVPITDGELDLGPWEQIFYAEFDGQRRKRVVVKVMGMSRRQGQEQETAAQEARGAACRPASVDGDSRQRLRLSGCVGRRAARALSERRQSR